MTGWSLVRILISYKEIIVFNSVFNGARLGIFRLHEPITACSLSELDVLFDHVLLDALVFTQFTTSCRSEGDVPSSMHVRQILGQQTILLRHADLLIGSY